MNEFVRLIALAIVTFLVAMVVTIISNPDLARAVAARVGFEYGVDDEFGARMPVPLIAGEQVLPVRRPRPDHWVGVAGFPDSAEVRFPLPPDTGVVEGQLQLVLNSQMVEGGDGQLSVWINGVERDVVVIRPGEERRTLVYRLSDLDLSGAAVRVRLSGAGSTNRGRICPAHTTDLGVAVEIDPASALMLDLGERRLGADGVLATRVAPLWLAGAGDDEAGAMALWAAQYLPRLGVPAGLDDRPGSVRLEAGATSLLTLDRDGGVRVQASPDGIDRVARLRGGALPPLYQARWPVSATVLGADTDTLSFRGSRRWTLNYRLADLPGGIAPDRLDLALAVSRLPEPNDWNLRVTLNGALVHSSSADGRGDRIERAVPLPAWRQALTNTIEITLVDPTPNQGICRPGADAAAQLLAASEMHWVGADPVNPREALVRSLATADTVSLVVPAALKPAITRSASALLGQILPLHTRPESGGAGPRITVLDAETLDQHPERDLVTRFLVRGGLAGQPGARVERLESGQSLPAPAPGEAALLIEW
ncbi:hypothetical protein ACLD02_01890 [Alloalcanivorax sp. C16-2]|uniref:hypothetical protein n=1 Tax=Alloalcanivorax sp. C16-2 TaxID=3390052 RepID=UPI003970D0EE